MLWLVKGRIMPCQLSRSSAKLAIFCLRCEPNLTLTCPVYIFCDYNSLVAIKWVSSASLPYIMNTIVLQRWMCKYKYSIYHEINYDDSFLFMIWILLDCIAYLGLHFRTALQKQSGLYCVHVQIREFYIIISPIHF